MIKKVLTTLITNLEIYKKNAEVRKNLAKPESKEFYHCEGEIHALMHAINSVTIALTLFK